MDRERIDLVDSKVLQKVAGCQMNGEAIHAQSGPTTHHAPHHRHIIVLPSKPWKNRFHEKFQGIKLRNEEDGAMTSDNNSMYSNICRVFSDDAVGNDMKTVSN